MPTAPAQTDRSVHSCPYCDRRERTADLLVLHIGEEHWETATPDERDRYRKSYERESETLRRFRLLALGALVFVYFGFLFAYAVVG